MRKPVVFMVVSKCNVVRVLWKNYKLHTDFYRSVCVAVLLAYVRLLLLQMSRSQLTSLRCFNAL